MLVWSGERCSSSPSTYFLWGYLSLLIDKRLFEIASQVEHLLVEMINMYMTARRNSLIFVIFLALLFILLWNPCESLKPKRCHKKKYKMDISPPGIPNCRKRITVVKCEGYCHSESKPASSRHGLYFETTCFCCQPERRKERKITFPCGSTVEILHIKKCQCKLC